MSENSKIEWTTHTFNPWIGCTKVSPGCAHCYAETRSKRTDGVVWGKGQERKRTSAANWKQPLKWDREALQPIPDAIQAACPVEIPGPRPRVFCASLADWLDDEVPIEWLADLLALIHATPNLDWQLLTKRPQNWQLRLDAVTTLLVNDRGVETVDDAFWNWLVFWSAGNPPDNIWIGTSVEDQARADERIPALLQIPAAVRFLSCEPLLGPVDLTEPLFGVLMTDDSMPRIDWVIAGGESGPKARPCNLQWIRSLVAQGKAASVPVFVKQLGGNLSDADLDECTRASGRSMHDRKGGDMAEWPEDLRVREFPTLEVKSLSLP